MLEAIKRFMASNDATGVVWYVNVALDVLMIVTYVFVLVAGGIGVVLLLTGVI